MQFKAFVCLLGIFLLLLLAVAGFLCAEDDGEEGEPPPPESGQEEKPVPVVEHFSNIWIMEAGTEGILCYIEGEERLLRVSAPAYPQDGQSREGNQIRRAVAVGRMTGGRPRTAVNRSI